MISQNQCPNCGSYDTRTKKQDMMEDIRTGIFAIVVSFGLAAFIIVPGWLIKYPGKDLNGCRCVDCKYKWS